MPKNCSPLTRGIDTVPSRGPSAARTTSTTRTTSTARSVRTAAAAVGCVAVLSLTAGSVSAGPVATSQVTAQNDQTGHQLDVAGPDVVYTSPGPGIEEEQVLLAA